MHQPINSQKNDLKGCRRWTPLAAQTKGAKSMTEFPLQMTDHPAETDWQRLEDNINQFNILRTGYDDYRPLAIFVRDAAGFQSISLQKRLNASLQG